MKGRWAMRVGIVVLACGLLPGCAHWAPETRRMETAYLAVHAVDVAQTLTIARNPDTVHERESDWLLGRFPSRRTVAAWGVGQALLHATVTDGLERWNAPPWAIGGWQYLTFGYGLDTVRGNWRLGIRLDGLTRELRDRCRGRTDC